MRHATLGPHFILAQARPAAKRRLAQTLGLRTTACLPATLHPLHNASQTKDEVKLYSLALLAALTAVSQNAHSNLTTIAISGISSAYPQVDTMKLIFDDSAGAVPVPYWLNGFVFGSPTHGYSGTLQSSITAYKEPVFVAFTSSNDFYLFQECALNHKCYLALSTATNSVPITINPRIAGNLASYFQENLLNLTTFAGTNSGWNVSYNTLPAFPETFPWLQVVKPSEILISSIPEPSTAMLYVVGGFLLLATTFRRTFRTEA